MKEAIRDNIMHTYARRNMIPIWLSALHSLQSTSTEIQNWVNSSNHFHHFTKNERKVIPTELLQYTVKRKYIQLTSTWYPALRAHIA